MHPKEIVNNALKDAMKNKDGERRDALRLLTSAFKQVEIDERRDVTEQEAMDILQKEAKKRRESIAELEKATGREDSLNQEKYELTLIEEFLPKQLSRDEVEVIVKAAIQQTGAASAKEMGKVMGAIQPQVKGRADGKLVSDIVKALLS